MVDDGQPGAAGVQGNDGARDSFGPAGRGADAGAGESGDEGAGERTGLGNQTGAEVSQQRQDGERDGKTREKQGEDAKEQESKDQPPILAPASEAETGQQGDASSEASPDQNADDPVAALEQRMLQALERRDAERDERDTAREAEHKAEIDRLANRLDEFETRHEEDQAKIRELQARLEPAPDSEPDGGKDPDQVKAEQQRSDRLPQSVTVPDDTGGLGVSPNQDASLDARKEPRQSVDENLDKIPPWRRVVTSDNVSLAGTLAGAADTVAQFSMHATPEGIASLGIMTLGLVSLALGKFEKHGKDKK
jgi:hypothetical protein